MELYKPDIKQFELFINSYFDVIEKMFGADTITTAAINGHAPAGSCIVSLLCEYRVMVAGKGRMGFNDTAVGILPPKWTTNLIKRIVGVRWTEYVAVTATMFRADDALKIGLVDDVAADKTDAIDKCKKFIHMANKIPSETRILAKRALREEYLTDININRKQYLQDFVKTITNSPTKDLLEQYVHTLKERKKSQ